ncbi:3-hydroxyacyl-CoA dehydrogenase family protein, partial [Streptomyces milbemycinicus]
PGFIVNRIARPFYAEAFRAYEEHGADPATLDAVLRESGGFRMGPFELTDLIGQDVNESVTRSVWEALFHDPKFTPSLAQRRLVASRRLGRKTGHGWFDHTEGAGRPGPHTAGPCEPPGKVTLHGDLGPAAELVGFMAEAGIPVTREPAGSHLSLPDGTRLSLTDGTTATCDPFAASVRFDLALDYRTAGRVALAPSPAVPEASLRSAIGLFQALGKRVSVVQDIPGMIVARTVAMLVDFAEDAAARGVADPEDIDTAMLTGVNYPRGPLAWGRALGARWVRDTLRNLHEACPTGRYAPSQALIRRAAAEEKLL